MSEFAYVKKSEWETVKARLNNVKIKFSRLAKKASVKPFGSGAHAGINITLPKSSGAAATPFQLALYSETVGEVTTYKVGMSTGGMIYSPRYDYGYYWAEPITEASKLVTVPTTSTRYAVLLDGAAVLSIVRADELGAVFAGLCTSPNRFLLGWVTVNGAAVTVEQVQNTNISANYYGGAFAVEVLNNVQVRLLAYAPSEGRLFRNNLILGLQVLEVAGYTLSVSSSSYVVLRIQGGETYTTTAFIRETIPEQTATDAYIPLAYVYWQSGDEGKITGVQQLQYGNIVHLGRVF